MVKSSTVIIIYIVENGGDGCIKMIETILAPIYIYLYAGEEPIGSTYIGGTILIATIIGHSVVALREEHPPVVVDDNDEEDDTNDEINFV